MHNHIIENGVCSKCQISKQDMLAQFHQAYLLDKDVVFIWIEN